MRRRVVVFAKAPVLGQVKRRLAERVGAERALELYRAMVADVTRVARAVDPEAILAVAGPVEAFAGLAHGMTVVAQAGASLGARLAAAVADLPGATVAIVGSDHPCITARDLDACLAGVREGRICLGPVQDGGYWCLAAPGGADLRPVLTGVPWSTEAVLEVTRRRARQAGWEVELGPESFDVDDKADLARARRLLARDPSRAPSLARVLGIR